MATTEEEAQREEYFRQIRSEYKEELREELKEELTEEILQEEGEEHQVWIDVRPSRAQKQIAAVASSLASLLQTVQRDNFVAVHQDVLSDLEKQQLIALLEAALAELKGPTVDRGRFGYIQSTLNKLFFRAVEKEVEGGIKDALDVARKKLLELLDELYKSLDQLDLF